MLQTLLNMEPETLGNTLKFSLIHSLTETTQLHSIQAAEVFRFLFFVFVFFFNKETVKHLKLLESSVTKDIEITQQ